MARRPKSITATNWPVNWPSHPADTRQTSKRASNHDIAPLKGRNESVVYSAWDNSTIIVSADDTPSISLHRAYHTAFLLRQILVPDLVPHVLHHAQIFTRSSYCKQHELSVARSHSPHTYLVTPPIRCAVRLKNPIRRVVFTIVARDQGLDLDIGQSHFTAGIIRRAVGDCGREQADQSDAFAGRIAESERCVVRNTAASIMYETHVVEWSVDSADAEESAWVRGLRNGDRIAVKALAQWASFENRIASIDVALHSAAVVK